ncbi:MAG: spore cortex-lytic enzyme [Clostridiales bacterium]|jgi:N-acetylmuramoyl-L-alanine amidase|nr:spore cortex-lytic enzyme [Clostridiales bacterium]
MIKRKYILSFLVAISLIMTSFSVQKVTYAAVYTWGSSGETVKLIQKKLKNWGYYEGEVDGKFGMLTFEAVKYFQRKNNLTIDGIVGAKTLEALGIFENSEAATASSFENDVWLLACVINGEGRGESYLGQVAIGAVVVNRVESPLFPDTLSGVVYQPGAFDAVSDGQVKLTPSESCLDAARDALRGWDPTGGALFYWNPKTATSQWIKQLTVVKEIGNHVFGMNYNV